ncbi:MAG: NAD(P)H-dependent oxidoreductase [Anaerolineaceae bacterium]
MPPAINILAISGSVRPASSNAALLHAAARLAPEGVAFTFYEGLDTLPHFNPDLDREGATPAPAVSALRAAFAAADGFAVSSPEYAHGVPGSLKNALDWLVSSGEQIGKPLILLNASPNGGQHGQAALLEILKVMSANVLEEASLIQPFLRAKPTADGELTAEDAALVRASLVALGAAVVSV